MLPEEGIFEPAPPIDQRGHTGSITLVLGELSIINVLSHLPESASEGWADLTPPSRVDGHVTDYVSFIRTESNIIVEGPTTLRLFWK